MLHRLVAAFAILALLAGCAAPAPPPPPPPPPPKLACDTLDHMLHKLEKNASYAYTADAIDSHEKVHEWFVNPKTRKWVQIHIYSNLRACIEFKGSDWHWAVDH